MARVPAWAVGLVKLADRTDVELYGLGESPDRVAAVLSCVPRVRRANAVFSPAELEARIRAYAGRAARRLPVCGGVARAECPARWCPWCLGRLGPNPRMEFCSGRCRKAWARWRAARQESRLPAPPRVPVGQCRECGGDVFGRADKVFCSPKCRLRATRARRKGA
jgi:predicted nucleic acid-binding Zn ribbon protein